MDKEIFGFLKKASRMKPYNNIFLQNTAIQSIYNVNSTINPFKQLKHALESKLSNFKIFETAVILSHSFTH